MKNLTKELCALAACVLAVGLISTATTQAAQIAELTVYSSPSSAQSQTLLLEPYGYQSASANYAAQGYQTLDTTVNTVSMGADLQFVAMDDDVQIAVTVLTDLNADGYYEYLNTSSQAAYHYLDADGTLASSDGNSSMSAGEQRTLAAAQLLSLGLAAEQSRMADGDTPLSSLSLVDSGNLIYCITTQGGNSPGQSYYFQLDYSLDTTIPAENLGAGIFTDVASWAWYWDEVDWAVREGLLHGISATQFSPDGSTTRAALMEVLYLQAGAPTTSLANFSDVSSGDWFANSVSWGYGQGLVSGFGNNTFQPNTALSREQLAVILYNYLQPTGQPTTDLSDFVDGEVTSSWATTAVCWALDTGILDEQDGGILNPLGDVSRASLAAVLMALDALV